jgi:hypothetical protein
MENAPNHGLDKDDGSNDSAQRVPSSPQGVRPVLATHRHLQPDNTNNNKSSRTKIRKVLVLVSKLYFTSASRALGMFFSFSFFLSYSTMLFHIFTYIEGI